MALPHAMALALLLVTTGNASAQGSAVKGDVALGQYLSSECVTCHQASGRSAGGVPAIVGMDTESFYALMDSYRQGHRDNAVMQTIAAKLSDDEIMSLAAYFFSLQPPK